MARPILPFSARLPGRCWETARRATAPALFAGLLAIACLFWSTGASAQIRGSLSANTAEGFARLLLEFEQPVEQKTTVANGVLVISFASAVDVDTSKLAETVPGYVAAARLDPDKKTLRVALTGRSQVNTIVARNHLYIDLLPDNWVGPPPGLPQEVIAELIRKAEEEAGLQAGRLAGDGIGVRPVKVRVGRYPTFTRVVFEWDEPTDTVLSRENDSVVVSFSRPSEIDLSRLIADPPPLLTGATARRDKDKLIVTLAVETGTDVRGFREGNTYIVDLAEDSPTADLTGNSPFDGGALASGAPGDAAIGETRLEADADAPVGNEDGDSQSDDLVSITVTPLELENKQDGHVAIGQADASAPQAVPEGDGAEDDAASPAAEADAPRVAAEAAEDAEVIDFSDAGSTDPNAPVTVDARLVGSTLRLTFPFVVPVASAAFQRANTLWIVFDSNVELNTGAITKASEGLVTDIDLVRANGVQILRLKLSHRYLATSTVEETRWIVSIGDQVLAPTEALVLERTLREDSLAIVSIALADSGSVRWISDDSIGDRLAIVTAFGPPRGLIKRQEFVDFTALTTAHGIAVRPHADDLAVRLTGDEVKITRLRGLNISAGRWPKEIARVENVESATRPGFIDFEAWRGDEKLLLRRKVQKLINEVSALPVDERANHRLRLARLYISHELGIEALGVMRIAEHEDGDVVNDPVFRAMRGIARVMAGRPEEAREDLLSLGLNKDSHVALWRGLIAVADRDWRGALGLFKDAERALEAYPLRQQARFLLAAARAGLETGTLDEAARSMEALKGVALNRRDEAERALLAARLSEAFGDDEVAMEAYGKLSQSRVRPVAAEAEHRRITAFLRAGRMTRPAAIKALESVSVVWRGDSIELATLRKLAALYIDEERYREALETMKAAVVNHPSGQLTRLIGDDMAQLFNRLFLDGLADAMEPIAALGLYYDFRELTPIGRRGDEMIRRLARRLVDVDLLDQAADLLDHQVSNRLTGTARAQVAADLTLIHLQGHKPELALRAIHQSRQAVLPQALQERRNMLEARALADLGRVELAVEILNTMIGPEVERLKADALWRGERWREAGEQIERMLGARWQGSQELSEDERLDVLRAAVGYALSNDGIGLERLRRKYITKMASSPDASSFELVTGSAEQEPEKLSALTKEIAAIDTLETFLADFRSRYGGSGTDAVAGAAADTGS